MSLPRVVLVHPRNHDNLVSIAHVMQTFGLRDWVVVSQAAFLEPLLLRARERAGLTLTPTRVERLADAVAGFEVVVGTTMRELPGKPRLTARELGLASAHSPMRWALVFGTESNGLSNDDLKHCNALAYLPTEPEQPSVNLSQALLLFVYELHAAVTAPEVMADVKTFRALRETLASTVRAHGMPRRVADELIAPLIRGRLSREAAEFLDSLARER